MSEESTSAHFISTTLRVLVSFVTYALLLVATTTLVTPATGARPGDALWGLTVAGLASAGVVSFLVLRSRWSGSKLALRIGLVFFAAHTALPELEAFAWRGSFARSSGAPAVSLFVGAVFATAFALAAVLILGRAGSHLAPRRRPLPNARSLTHQALGVGGATVAYMIVYFALGSILGWYSTSRLAAPVNPGELLWVEAARGLLWALIARCIVHMLHERRIESAVAVGAYFALAGEVQLLLPSTPSMAGLHEGSGAFAASQFVLGVCLAFWFARADQTSAARPDDVDREPTGPAVPPTLPDGRRS